MSEWCNGSTASPMRLNGAVGNQMAGARSIRASLTPTSDADSLPEGCGAIPSTRGEYRVYEDQPRSQATTRAGEPVMLVKRTLIRPTELRVAKRLAPNQSTVSDLSRVPVLAYADGPDYATRIGRPISEVQESKVTNPCKTGTTLAARDSFTPQSGRREQVEQRARLNV